MAEPGAGSDEQAMSSTPNAGRSDGDGTLRRYSRELLIALRDSPLVGVPPGLPPPETFSAS